MEIRSGARCGAEAISPHGHPTPCDVRMRFDNSLHSNPPQHERAASAHGPACRANLGDRNVAATQSAHGTGKGAGGPSALFHTTSVNLAIVTETFPPEVNGVAMTFGVIARELGRRGHHVTVVHPRRN